MRRRGQGDRPEKRDGGPKRVERRNEGGDVRLSIDFADLARSNSIDLREALRQQRQQIFKAIRFGTQNHDRNFSASQILLVLDTLTHGEENIESG